MHALLPFVQFTSQGRPPLCKNMYTILANSLPVQFSISISVSVQLFQLDPIRPAPPAMEEEEEEEEEEAVLAVLLSLCPRRVRGHERKEEGAEEEAGAPPSPSPSPSPQPLPFSSS